MNAELNRLKNDLKTLGQALGSEPEFNRCQVWRSIGLGISGIGIMLMAVISHKFTIRPWEAGAFVLVLCLGSHYLLPRFFCSNVPRVASTADKDMNYSISLCAIATAVLLGFIFWLRRLGIPQSELNGIVLFFVGAVTTVWTWRRPWRRFALAFAFAFMALGIAMPFLREDRETITLVTGAAFAASNFLAAIILCRQLKEHYANGQAAH